MLRVVIDTSVLIRALRSRRHPASASVVVVREAIAGLLLVPVVDVQGVLEAEYREVAARPEHAAEIRGRLASEVIDALLEVSERVDAGSDPHPATLPDEDDRMVIDAARAAQADAIVTWNERDFPADVGVRAITPAQLLAELRAWADEE